MPMKDPGRIPVGLFHGEDLSDDAVRRLSVGSSRIVAFAEGAAAVSIADQWARVAPDIPVETVGGASDIREAVIEAAKRKVIWVAAPAPRNAARFVGGALQGAAAATEFEIPSVAVHVLRDQVPEGPVAWLTQTGEMSGYGVLYAAAMAAMSGRTLTLIEPTELRAPRTPEAADAADRYIEQAGIDVERTSDPAPLAKVLTGSFGTVVHPVLDAPGGRSLLRPGELPAKSVASGNAAAVVELIEKAPGDVVAVFDGVQLVYGGGAAAKVAASVALGVVALTGVGAMSAPAAMAAPAHATGNVAEVKSMVQDVEAVSSPHSGAGTTLRLSNNSDHSIDVEVTGFHGHGGSAAAHQTVTIPAHGWVDVTDKTGGIKRWDVGPHNDATPHAVPQTPTQNPTATPNLEPQQVPTETPTATPPLTPPTVVTGTQTTFTAQSPVPEGQPHAAFKGKDKGQQGTSTPTATPTEAPQPQPQAPNLIPPRKPDVPDIQVNPVNVPPVVGHGPVGTQAPGPEGHSTVPTPTQIAAPPLQPAAVTPETGTGTPTTPTTGTTDQTPGAQVTTPAGQVTPGSTVTTAQTQEGGSTTQGATHHGGTTQQAATSHSAAHAPTATTAGGPGQLAHTGAGETGILAGLAAVLMAAGAGITVAARRNRDDREESLEGLTT
jgi:hypothetical protein